MINPLQNDFSIELNKLSSRQRTIQYIASHISEGFGVALIAEPRMGKTALLEYLRSTENIEKLYGEEGKKYVFSLINCQMLTSEYTLWQFWEQVLSVIDETVEQSGSHLLLKLYVLCKNSKYRYFELEKLFHQLDKLGYKLILMLDELDTLVAHPTLGTSDFFGILRGMSNFSGLTTLIATRQSLSKLNESLYQISRLGSPYLNVFTEIRLKVLPPRDIAELLNNTNNIFSRADKQFISEVSGGHPFILQIAMSALLNSPKRNSEDITQRYVKAGRKVYEATQLHYHDLWHFWTADIRKAIVAIALLQTPHLLANKEFHQSSIKDNLHYLEPELGELNSFGLIDVDDNFAGGYKINQGSLLWWLADELIRTIREDSTFEEWLLEKQLVGGLVSQKELESLKTLAKLLDKGATTLIEAYAKAISSK